MSFFSESGLTASRAREKLYLCDKCGLEMIFKGPDEGYCCPKGHGCGWPSGGEQKIIRDTPGAVYAGGAIEFTGTKAAGKKRKKQPKKSEMVNIYDRP